MTRLSDIKIADNVREAAELLMPLICKTKECSGDCEECRQEVERYLEEDLGE